MASVASREHNLYNNPSELEAAARNVAFHWRTPDGFYYPNSAWMRPFTGNGSFVRFLGPQRSAAKGRIGSGTVRRFAAMNGCSAAIAVIDLTPVDWRYRPIPVIRIVSEMPPKSRR